MNQPTSNTEPEQALAWLAFRYVADEMSQSEQSDFEDRLATDQSAREAVADAVEQTQLIFGALADRNDSPTVDHRCSLKDNHSTSQERWSRRVSRPGVLFATTTVLFFLATTWFFVPHQAAEMVSAMEPERLAVVWADSLELNNPELSIESLESSNPEIQYDMPTDEIENWMVVALTEIGMEKGEL